MNLESFIDYCHQNLMSDSVGQSYLLSRGSNSVQWSRHKIGLLNHDAIFSCDHDHLPTCDVCRLNEFLNNLHAGDRGTYVVYPYFGYSNKCYGFQCRNIVQKEFSTFLVNRRPESFFFGIHNATFKIFDSKHVVLVEGPSDALVVDKVFPHETLALTTNVPNESQLRFLARFVNKITMFLDNDGAGREGMLKISDRLGGFNIAVRSVSYPRGIDAKDPADLWKHFGDIKFQQYLLKEVRK